MRTDRPIRVGVFDDAERARRVVDEARTNGFSRITVVTDDAALQERFHGMCDVRDRSCIDPVHQSPGQVSLTAGLIGAGVGLIVGFVGVWLFQQRYGPPGAIMNVSIPLAGVVWGAFIGAMISRGWQGEAETFFDQELQEGEILVAIEDKDPMRLQLAERILRGVGVSPVPLSQG